MTTAGGGWTLVASVHENNIYGKCTVGDRWTSQQGNNPKRPQGEGNWVNTNTFGTAEAATADDFKNPGYYDIQAEDMSVWHVPNDTPMKQWSTASIMRYHTETRFLSLQGGNLQQLFLRFPYSSTMFYGPATRRETEGGFLSFRAINAERASTAICSGVKPKGGQVDAYCVGGGIFP
ncbi:hypothetical protein DPEC_G00289050 [Dallia pectoralis]|uniref:Uncharacterized protein n=1 Tax=Dallia pectoralis TaxID=75939 RepID=A0ACC2FKV6_DALPE|nr:hypothetical protein DPEC_G00289050 [Dallia pectoralis]